MPLTSRMPVLDVRPCRMLRLPLTRRSSPTCRESPGSSIQRAEILNRRLSRTRRLSRHRRGLAADGSPHICFRPVSCQERRSRMDRRNSAIASLRNSQWRLLLGHFFPSPVAVRHGESAVIPDIRGAEPPLRRLAPSCRGSPASRGGLPSRQSRQHRKKGATRKGWLLK